MNTKRQNFAAIVVALSLALGCTRADPKQRPGAAGDSDVSDLAPDKIDEVLADTQRQVEQVGSESEGAAFDDRPQQPALLVGFAVSTGTLDGERVVWSVQPIYVTPVGKVVAKTYGRVRAVPYRVEAREGYAVGALIAQPSRADGSVGGFRLVFMRREGSKLDPNDYYESRWIGGRAGGDEIVIGAAGRPIIGVRGRSDDRLRSLGVIQADEAVF